jgi:TAG lipase/steryl ester hydrolase/phospholipase A2/LPA acyltransferase
MSTMSTMTNLINLQRYTYRSLRSLLRFLLLVPVGGSLRYSNNYIVSSFSFCIQLLSTIFSPTLIVKQVFALTILQVIYEGAKFSKNTIKRWNTINTAHRIEREIEHATTFQQWQDASKRLQKIYDTSSRRNTKKDTKPPHDSSDSILLQKKTNLYSALLRKRDVPGLMFHLRKDLLRGHQENKAAKRVLNEYRQTVIAALRAVAEYHHTVDASLSSPSNKNHLHVSIAERIAFFNETRHSFGRSALCLSGGATLGLYHIGVIKSLYEAKLLPRVISGASAGSIMAAILGTRKDNELPEIFLFENINARFFSEAPDCSSDNKTHGKNNVTTKTSNQNNNTSNKIFGISLDKYISMLPPPLPMLLSGLFRKVDKGYALDIHTLEKALRENCGDVTFQEAFDRTGRIVNIVVTPTRSGRIPMVLNYLTSPHVLLWSAALASCAVPGVFEPVELRSRSMTGEEIPYFPQGQRWSDGSVENDLPMQRLSELFNVNHFIVSQVNPHALFFAGTSLGSSRLARIIQYLKLQVKAWIKNVSMLSLQFGIPLLGKGLLPLLTQKYEGDITLVPRWGLNDLLELFKDPDKNRFDACILEGERITWPKLERLKQECQVERVMDQCTKNLRLKLARQEEELFANLTSSISENTMTTRRTRIPSFTTSASLLGINALDAGAPGPGNISRKRRPSFIRTKEL